MTTSAIGPTSLCRRDTPCRLTAFTRAALFLTTLGLAVLITTGDSAADSPPSTAEPDPAIRLVEPDTSSGYVPSTAGVITPDAIADLLSIDDLGLRYRAPRASPAGASVAADEREVLEVAVLDLTMTAIAGQVFEQEIGEPPPPDVERRRDLAVERGAAVVDVSPTVVLVRGTVGRFVVLVRATWSGDSEPTETVVSDVIQRQLDALAPLPDLELDGPPIGDSYATGAIGMLISALVLVFGGLAMAVGVRDTIGRRRFRSKLELPDARPVAAGTRTDRVDELVRTRRQVLRRRRLKVGLAWPALTIGVLAIVAGSAPTGLAVTSLALAGLIAIRRGIRHRQSKLPALEGNEQYRRAVARTARPSMLLAYLIGVEMAVVTFVAMLLGALAGSLSEYVRDPVAAQELADGSTAMPIAAAGLALGVLPYRWAAARARRSTMLVRNADPRAPVLLLRSFVDDSLKIRAHRTGRHSFWERVGFRRWDFFEEVVAARLWVAGPVVAIGEPGSRAPALGAARDYFGEDDWMTAADTMMRSSRATAVVVGTTTGLEWELRRIRELGIDSRVIYIIPPSSDFRQRLELLDRAYGWNLNSTVDTRTTGFPLVITITDDEPVIHAAVWPSDLAYESAIDVALADVVSRSGWPAPVGVAQTTPLPAPPRARGVRSFAVLAGIGALQLLALGVPLVAFVEFMADTGSL